MAWRNIIVKIVRRGLEMISRECIESFEAAKCAEALIAFADAVYSPLKPVDAGLGEAKRIASRLASIAPNYFLARAIASIGEERAKEVYEAVKSREWPQPVPGAATILEGVGVKPASAPEPREAVVKELADYFEPPTPPRPRRRRQEPRRPDPLRELRRILRELGRRDPLLARALATTLRGLSVEV